MAAVTVPGRSYRYVGPDGLRESVRPGTGGHVVRSSVDLDSWASRHEASEPVTYVVGQDGFLRLAPRRSEHVVCAGGGEVLGAGEMTFHRAAGGWTVREVSNQSAGYCPDLDSWHAVAGALDRAGVGHPGRFTHPLVFRRCQLCREHNIVHDDDFVCVFCGGDLPPEWNVAP